ncbi:MAG TPA: thiamine pyrophosphate-binding protein [Kiloniellaceae bacterium]|nr:thiamine pyrophosphate-binding protein [Kiloniellaceae bacterium]
MNVSEVIAAFLKQAGVECIFGYPGDPSVEFLEGARRQGTEFVLATREGTAGLMAEAYGMITGKPGVALSTLGPGSTNLVNAVANAFLDRVPMLAISGQIDRLRKPTFTHQVVDQQALFTPVAKWVAEIAPETVGHVLRKAHKVALSDRPGPVHLTTPADVVGAAAGNDDIALAPTAANGGLTVLASPGSDPVRMLKTTRRPIILYGLSAQRHDVGGEIADLADALGAAIVSSPMAKGCVREDHARFAGVLDMACSDLMWDFMSAGDLILAVGFDAVELIKPWSLTAPVIHVDTVPNLDQIYAAEVECVGPIAQTLQALRDEAAGPGWSEHEIAEHRTRLHGAFEQGRVRGRLNPSDVVAAVRAWAPEETVITADVGSHKLLVGQGWTTYRNKGVLMTNGLSSMGFSLPAAITASKLRPDDEVVCFTGDGGLAMVQSELRLAASLGLAFRVIVFCDNSLNRIELKQMQRQYPPTGTRIDPTDVVKLAESMGCAGAMAQDTRGLESLLAERAPGDRPLVIGAEVDPSQYWEQF